jgi:hypothetical protein
MIRACLMAVICPLALAGCSGNHHLYSLLSMSSHPRETYDNGSYDPTDERAIQEHADRKWALGAPYWQVAGDILKSNPRVEPPGPPKSPSERGRNPHSHLPQSTWIARFGADYIEVIAGTFWWYGQWWYTVLLEFEEGSLRSIHVYSDNFTL